MRRKSPLPWLVLSALALGTTAREAEAFCRSSVCADGSQGKVCSPTEFDDCGKPLFWAEPCTGFSIHKRASSQFDYATAKAALEEAADAWTTADCGGGQGPSIRVTDLGEVECGSVEYNQHAGNAHVVVFRDVAWPHQGEANASTDAIALTTVTYDVDTGAIYDADIEVNTHEFSFSTDTPSSWTDLRSVLTHEMGHFLGLSHSSEPKATMVPVYPGGTELRSLGADDVHGICNAYPRGRSSVGKCDSIPRHGFSPACAEAQTETQCSFSAGANENEETFPISFALALAALAARRRRSR